MNRRMPKISRRALLGGSAATLAATPFLPSLRAEAADEHPLRLVLLYTPDGYTNETAWTPDTSGGTLTMGPVHTPLQPFADELMVLGGIRQIRMGTKSEHSHGMAGLYTGSMSQDNGTEYGATDWATGPSIDQVIAGTLEGEAPYSSLMLAARPGSYATTFNRPHYAGNGEPVTPESDPYALLDRLFEDAGVDPAELLKIRQGRQSVIDLVRDDLKSLEDYYGGAEAAKIEAHQDALRELETQLQTNTNCDSPDLGGPLDPNSDANYPEIIRLQSELIVTALSCGLTRISGLAMSSSGSNGLIHSWLGHTDQHHNLAHEPDDPASVTAITEIDTWYAERVAYLLGRLKEIPEGDGTLLDNTLVVWPREMARGSGHYTHSNGWVVAGGRGAAGLDTGRYIDYGDVASTRVLTTIGNLFGLGLSSFGNLNGEGPLDDWA